MSESRITLSVSDDAIDVNASSGIASSARSAIDNLDCSSLHPTVNISSGTTTTAKINRNLFIIVKIVEFPARYEKKRK